MNPIERMKRRFNLTNYEVFIVCYSIDAHLDRVDCDRQGARLALSNYEHEGLIGEHVKNVLRAINLDIVLASTISDILEQEY